MNQNYLRASNILNKDKCRTTSLEVLEAELKLFLSGYMHIDDIAFSVTELPKGLILRIEVRSDGFFGAGKAI